MKHTYKYLAVGVMIITSLLTLTAARAAHSDSLYVYDFRNAASPVVNQASANAGVNLNLVGAWSSTADGTTFTGNTTNTQSTSYAKPSTGKTIAATTAQAVGAAVIFTDTGNCATDSQNISQIGKFSTGISQVKLQLSKCASGTKTYPECRIAGASTPANTLAVRGTMQILPGVQYRLECVKTPDAGANATVIMRTTDIAANQTTTNNITIPATGALSSTEYLSAGGKWPAATQASNTDQFTGMITKLGYCVSADAATAQNCLTTEVALGTPPVDPPVDPPATGGSVDEVKYSYGNTRDQIVISWRGNESMVYYGTDTSYGSEATASASTITPVDIAGPFMETTLSGLSTNTTYHYKIGADGTDRTFTTAAGDDDDFSAIAIGDTIASTCRTYQLALNNLVASQSANFILHHGDIAIANECGTPATHQYFLDIENSYAKTSAYMPVWGNHEYGKPTANAPAGTPTDTLANYKGRLQLPNPQSVPGDTSTKTSDPGCGAEVFSTVNTCQGEDWGWFRSGRVLFISFPEPWYNAISDWRVKAGNLMAQAQADPTIDFVVTYGHRPVISSTGYTAPTGWETAFSQLAASYSPSATNPNGKFVLDLTGHRHNLEVFDSWNNLTQVVNGGGGQGLINFQATMPGSVYRAKHLGFSKLDYSATAHALTFSMICGPSFSGEAMTCTPGQTLYTKTFSR